MMSRFMVKEHITGTSAKLKHIESDVAVYEEPTIGLMMAFLPSDTLGMYLETLLSTIVLHSQNTIR
jgi:hypothetical protein